MFRRVDDFLAAYDTLTEGTLKVFERLTDDVLDRRVADGHRSIREIAWHIAVSVPEMMKMTGLELNAVDHAASPPDSAAELLKAYRLAADELKHAVRDSWSDEDLERTDELYGEKWQRGLTLAIVINHENHHRAQVMVLMRQAGVAVPGLFGPAKEEWSQYGMELPAY